MEVLLIIALVVGGVYFAASRFRPRFPRRATVKGQPAPASKPPAHIGASTSTFVHDLAAGPVTGARSGNAFTGLKVQRSRGIDFGAFNASLPTQPPPPPDRGFQRDRDYEATEGVREVFEALHEGAPVVLVYGGAGVGKSHLVRYLKAGLGGDRTVVVAPTAIAALTSGGQTIHSFFQFPPRVLDPRHLESFRGNPGQVWKGMTRLIVDEISMVRPDLVDSIHARLRQMRKIHEPFGGVRVVLVGDPLQLPPVAKPGEIKLLNALKYKTPFLHSAHIWPYVKGARAVELTKVYRQTEADFIAALNDLRRGDNLVAVTEFFNDRCFRLHRDGATPVLLTPTRAAADRYNADGLQALPGPDTVFRGVAVGRFDIQREQLPVPEWLPLRIGAEVMTVTNDLQHRWVNGSRGRVLELRPDAALVRFYGSGETHLVSRHSWSKVKQTWDHGNNRILDERQGEYNQLPLIPGWALTIHKAQGMTLDDVRVDIGDGTFASGQLYVAVSRARSLAGLSLARPLTPADVKPDDHLLAFMGWLEDQRANVLTARQ